MASSLPDASRATSPLAAQGMACLDTSGSTRLPILMEMVAGLSRAKTPKEVLSEFARGFGRLQPFEGYISLSTRGLPPGHYRITRLFTDDSQMLSDVDSWSSNVTFPVHEGGLLGQIIRQAYPEVIHHLNVPDDPVIGDALAGFGSLMALPLFDDGEPLNWSISLRHDPEAFTVRDLEGAILRGNLVGATVRNVLAANRLQSVNERTQSEVERIATIQRALLPKELPAVPGVAIGASYETFDLAGGDLYDIHPLRKGADGNDDVDGPWAILIGDASGHGPAAAVVMAMLVSIVDAFPREPDGPAELLFHANQHLCRKHIERSFVTAFLAFYDPTTRAFTYARAGHDPPILMTPADTAAASKSPADGTPVCDRLDCVGSVPLGVIPDVEFEEYTITLEPGQTVVLYTDGITEAKSPDEQMFNVEGIIRSLNHCSGEPDCVINHVTSALAEHQQNTRPGDDQTLVVLRVD